MFRNIGRNIQLLAQILFWVLSLFSIIAGIVILIKGSLFGLIFLFAPLYIWIGSWAMYGFGVIVEVNERKRDRMDEEDAARRKPAAMPASADARPAPAAREVTPAPAAEHEPIVPFVPAEPDPSIPPEKWVQKCDDPEWTQKTDMFAFCPECNTRSSIDFLRARGTCRVCGHTYRMPG